MLYDDIAFLPQMQTEHDVFVKLLHAVAGRDNVVDVEDLLADILKVDNVRNEIISSVCTFEQCEEYEKSLSSLCPPQLVTALISGTVEGLDKPIFQPIANYIFCRDIAAIINNHILVGQAARKVRARESILSRYIFGHHNYFRNQKRMELSSMAELKAAYGNSVNPLSLEGGDVMMLGSHV